MKLITLQTRPCSWHIISSLTLACFFTVLPTKGQPAFLTNGLVAYYPFDGNTNDASGNGNDGNPGTAQISVDRFARPNSPYAFNGTDSFVTFSKTPTTKVDGVSMFYWLKPDRLPQWGIALSLGTADGNQPCNGFGLGIGDAHNSQPQLNGSMLLGENACVAWVNGNYNFQSTAAWHHVGFIRKNGQDIFFVDGVNVSTSVVASPKPPTSFCIGTLLGSDRFNSVFSGSIDEVRVYERALETGEVMALYNFENLPPPPRAATATAQVVDGLLVSVTITDGGSGYTNAPLVRIFDALGSGVMVAASIADGRVIQIRVINPGNNYSVAPRIIVASPPLVPELSIQVSRVRIALKVVLGHRHQLSSSKDLNNWTPVGVAFVAEDETLTQEFDVLETGQYFRIIELP